MTATTTPAPLTHKDRTTDPHKPKTRIGDPVPVPGSTKGECLVYDYETWRTARGTILSTLYEGIANGGFVTHVIDFNPASEAVGGFHRDLANVPVRPATTKRIAAQHAALLDAAKAAVAARLAWLAAHPDVFKSKGY